LNNYSFIKKKDFYKITYLFKTFIVLVD